MPTTRSNIQERLAAIKSKRGSHVKGHSNNHSDSSTELHSISRTGVSLYPIGREQSVENLKVAVALLIRTGHISGQGSDRRASAICRSLLTSEIGEKWFSKYCIEPYPDACSCGTVFYGASNNLRNHCLLCKGHWEGGVLKDMEWKYKGLKRYFELNFGIHKTWTEYAIAWYIARYQPVVIGQI
jgi:hypothetical protein